MNQPGKLDTIAPSMRKSAAMISPLPGLASNQAELTAADDRSVVVSTGAAVYESADTSIDISFDNTAKASVAFFSVQNLMALLPGWSASLVGHVILLIVLTVIATSPLNDQSTLRLDGLMTDASAMPVVQDLESEQEQNETDLLKVDVSALNSAASEDTADIVREDGFDVSLMEGISDGIGLEAMAQTGLTPIPQKDEGGVQGDTNGTSTRFFGTEATGSRFVFIIDASDSMNEGFRWHQAIRELEKSIAQLGEEQQAMVLLYNFKTFPMFDIPPKELKALPVTTEFKTELSKWLGDQIPIGGTRPAHALSYSLTLKPDAIFLLSDGMLADNSIQVLARENKAKKRGGETTGKVPVHTVSLGPNEAGAELMKFIADHNDGKFTWVR